MAQNVLCWTVHLTKFNKQNPLATWIFNTRESVILGWAQNHSCSCGRSFRSNPECDVLVLHHSSIGIEKLMQIFVLSKQLCIHRRCPNISCLTDWCEPELETYAVDEDSLCFTNFSNTYIVCSDIWGSSHLPGLLRIISFPSQHARHWSTMRWALGLNLDHFTRLPSPRQNLIPALALTKSWLICRNKQYPK